VELKRTKTAVLAVTVAAAITLSGTFAWQSISQMVLNEATEPTNPGGRLHDDFSGYGPNDTKDIYVENFGSEPIYARVRLDEYMEIGEGAGLKGTAGPGGITPNPDNHATSLVSTAKINDMTTWTTHIPAANQTEACTGGDAEKFHDYWTWYMGGQAEDNTEGKTVYMPTFNKNKDSLMADVNGTLAGTNPTDDIHYDDYKAYTIGETADRVRDTDTTTYPDGAAYDADADTTDECGPYGGAGGTGTAGVNYEMKEETHKAQETMGASVITMADYKDKSPADKAAFVGWVYDVDGWAYWSQPIAPGTPTDTDKFITNATGVLLDRIVLENKPSEVWYYGVNVVGQFITADDLGRSDDPQSGFYDPNGGKAPTNDALDLLEGIGVNTAAVKGSIVPSASVTVNGTVNHLSYAVQGMSIDLAAEVTVPSITPTDQNVTWTLTGNTDPDTKIVTTGGTPVLQVGSNEQGTLKLVAASTAYDRLKGKLTLPVHELAYVVTVTPDGNATSVLPGGTQSFTAVLSRNDFQPVDDADQAFTWELDTTGGAYATGTAIAADTDPSKATLTVAGNETGPVTVKATPTNATYSGVSGTATLTVTPVTYALSIKDKDGNAVTRTTKVKLGGTADFTLDVTSTPPGANPTNNWSWTSATTSAATVAANVADSTQATVTIPADATVGSTSDITVTNDDDPSLTVTFTVEVKDKWDTMTVDGIEYIVLVDNATITGKAKGEMVATSHQAALLLAKETQGTATTFDSSTNNWKNSAMRDYLNSTDAGKWLNGKTETQNKAITVELKTRQQFNSTIFDTTDDMVFLLSSADVCGKYHNGSSWVDCATEEYTYNGARLTCFKEGQGADPDRIAYQGSSTQVWWLRSPYYGANNVAHVTPDGTVSSGLYSNSYGVRPAFWYNLDP